METSYEVPNLLNQEKRVGICKNPFFFHITTGQRIKKPQFFKFQNHKNNFDTYFAYLCENYLNTDSKFRPSLWFPYSDVA